MHRLEIRAVVPCPRVFIDGTDPATGETVRTTIYSGYVALVQRPGFWIGTVDELEQVSFFLPDSAPYSQPPAALGVELGLRRFKSTSHSSLSQVHFGACDERAAVAPDPRGGDNQWLHLTFHTPVAFHALVEINYRVTVQSR
ncbi:hypothetical protein AB0C02_21115 [Micromonospora sp. NPDC048999]|uniref:hypothetical protein n=1 Tax=Micromonospora sp. NPDC048999 TaxID=3155391 RepID=UPI0033C51119